MRRVKTSDTWERIVRLMRTLFALLLAAAWCVTGAHASELLSPLFREHAVLQRDRPIVVWGQAQPRERIEVTLAGAVAHVRADARGNWRATLPEMSAGGPHMLSVRADSGASASADDVLIGDVYLCSGQSNMEFQTRFATNAASVLGAAESDAIRLLTVPREIAPSPRRELQAQWRRANAESVGDFSAVCYFFAREIESTARAPIGLIDASWGGTRIEAWMSARALRRAGGREEELTALAQAIAAPDRAAVAHTEALRAWWSERDPGMMAGWARHEFDDAAWPQMSLGGSWESSGAAALAGFDGVVWFRKHFTLTAQQAEQRAALELGSIDDVDLTSINGEVVGAQSGWDQPRLYELPAGLLRSGENTIAVGVLDTGGGGGLWGAAGARVLRFADGSSMALDGRWRYRISAELGQLAPPPNPPWGGPNGLTALYNAMIAPLSGVGLRGVLWYQGEANVSDPAGYEQLLPAMMQDWRGAFASPDLPFLVVQLANFGAPSARPQPRGWGALRDAQRRAVARDSHSGLAVAIDIGDRFDIHPTQKAIVAQRLARIARRRIYGEDLTDQGPAPIAARRVDGSIVVTFANGPLVAYSANRPIAFELCGEAGECRFVDASIDVDTVLLDAEGMASARVRYCWGDAPICNLYNEADLPAAPFEVNIE